MTKYVLTRFTQNICWGVGVHSGFPLCEKLHFQMEKSNRTEYNYNLNVSHIMPCLKSFHVRGTQAKLHYTVIYFSIIVSLTD